MLLLREKLIFIVEDNLQNRVVFQMALIRHGAQVEFDRWGDRSLLYLRRLPRVDVIIVDLMLADGVTGFTIFDQIRTEPTFNNVPVVAVSAMDPALALPKVRDKGFAGFIVKPINNRLFGTQIARIVAGERVWYTGDQSMP